MGYTEFRESPGNEKYFVIIKKFIIASTMFDRPTIKTVEITGFGEGNSKIFYNSIVSIL